MVSPELGLTVFLADSILYGFMVLYYTTSTALREQEKTWISVQRGAFVRNDSPGPGGGTPMSELDERWVNALAASAANNLFLLGCTLFAIPSLFLGVLSLLGLDVLGLWAVVLFLVFAFVVAVGMIGVGIQYFRLNVREARQKLGGDRPLMDILNRGLGKR